MKRTLLLLDIKPMSVNAMYLRTFNGVSKTSKASDWTYEVFYQLARPENQWAMQELRDYFDPKKHTYHIHVIAAYSKSELYTKDGQISAKTQDCTNFEKPIVDCIFLPKYHIENPPKGCPNLNYDDRALVRSTGEKALSISGRRGLIVDIEIRPISEVLSVDLGPLN